MYTHLSFFLSIRNYPLSLPPSLIPSLPGLPHLPPFHHSPHEALSSSPRRTLYQYPFVNVVVIIALNNLNSRYVLYLKRLTASAALDSILAGRRGEGEERYEERK
ncbi:hypothetical protein E2C01_045860 [Portunus trituberculatus]|uniref:Uncharacterized protein n=1 Tax=Portunus trituberculatus TaxID=210409 RepID=A0A5B7FWW5_PORTR|nr:hypothetical protein [Portunus trituberculatus]